jgi:hypothetical protein
MILGQAPASTWLTERIPRPGIWLDSKVTPAALWSTGREVALVEDIRAAMREIPVGGVVHIVRLEAAALSSSARSAVARARPRKNN